MTTIVTRTETQTDGTAAKGSELTWSEVDTNFINLNDDKVEVSGAIVFAAKAGEALTKGDVVYVSGVSGNEPVVSKADADDASKMPAFGLAEADANLNAAVNVVTFGTLYDLDTSAFSAGDTVYVSTTAGGLTGTKPAGEASLIQNIGRVIRSHASAGSIKVGGAGRSNDTPNLNDGNVFIGNASNQAETRALVEADISDLQAYLTAETNDLTAAVTWANVPDANITQSSVTQHQAALSITESQISDLGTYLTAEADTLDTVTGRGNTTSNAITVGSGTVTGNLTVDTDVVLGGGGTIGAATWANGQFHLGNSTNGWAMDSNEFYNSGNAIIGTLSGNLELNPAGNITTAHKIVSTNNAEFGDFTDITMNGSGAGQLHLNGNGYKGAIAMDASSMYIYNNSSGRNLVLGTNETARLTISGGGISTFSGLVVGRNCTDTNFNTANDAGSFSVRGDTTYPAVMSFHRSGAYAVNFGLEGTNMKLGGWSATTTKFLWAMASGDFHADGNVIAYSTTVSDERLKDDVQDITGALDTVDALRGVTYTWNAGSREGKRDYGVIAQEVEQVIPEIVHDTTMPLLGDEETVYKTVDYEKLCAVLINAVSELRAEVETLKNG